MGPDVAVGVKWAGVACGAIGVRCHRVVCDSGGGLCGVVQLLGLVHGQQAIDGGLQQLGQEATPAQYSKV